MLSPRQDRDFIALPSYKAASCSCAISQDNNPAMDSGTIVCQKDWLPNLRGPAHWTRLVTSEHTIGVTSTILNLNLF